MTFYQKLMAVAGLAAVIALIGLARRPDSGRRSATGSVACWLMVAAGALIVVGIVSNSVIHHLIQIAPLVLAILLSVRRSGIAVAAAAPLFAFWFLVMASIWLFLLGLARIFTGTFPPVEIALTLVIGAASAFGLAVACRQGSAMPLSSRFGTVIVFAVLQYAAMWLSTQPFAAAR